MTTVNGTAKTGTPTGTLVEIFLVSRVGVPKTLVTTTTTASNLTFSFSASANGANDSYLVKVNTGFSQNYSIVIPAGAGPFVLTDILASAAWPAYTLPAVTVPSTDYVNLSTYGVVGDGVTDDTTALNAAFAAGANKVIQLGNHKITATLNVPDGCTIRGKDNSANVITVPAGVNFNAFTVSGKNNVKIQNVKIVKAAGAAAVGGAGVAISGNSSNVTLSDLSVDSMLVGYYVTGGTGVTVKKANLTNCYATNSVQYGFEIDESDGLTMINCKSIVSGLDGFKLRKKTANVLMLGGYSTGATGGDGMDCYAGGNNFTIIGGTFSGNTINGITIKNDSLNLSDPTGYGTVGNVTVQGVRCNGNGGYGLTFHRHGSTDDVTLPLPFRCTVNGGNFNGNTNAGIFILGRQVSIVGAQCARNGQEGIRIQPLAMDISLIGCQVSGNSQTTVNTYSGIYIAGDRVQLVGGWSIGVDNETATSEADLAAITPQQKYGVEIASTATNVDLNTSFRTRYNATGNHSDGGTQTTRFMPGVAQYIRSGEYFVNPNVQRGTLAMAQSTEYCTPILIGNSGTIVRIGAEMTATAGAGTVVRLALRKNKDNKPGPLIGQTTIDGTAVAVVEATVSWVIDTPGLYWISACSQGGAATVRTGNGNLAPLSFPTISSIMGATPFAGYTTTNTITGAFVDTYTINSRHGTAPLVFLRG